MIACPPRTYEKRKRANKTQRNQESIEDQHLPLQMIVDFWVHSFCIRHYLPARHPKWVPLARAELNIHAVATPF